MDPEPYWRIIHSMKYQIKMLKGCMCDAKKKEYRAELHELEANIDRLIADFKDKEGY